MKENDIFEESGSFTIEPLDPAERKHIEAPDDLLVFDVDLVDAMKPFRLDLSLPAEMIAMLREAKEKHAPVMFTNNDETRALLIKDANDLNLKITVNGVPFEEI